MVSAYLHHILETFFYYYFAFYIGVCWHYFYSRYIIETEGRCGICGCKRRKRYVPVMEEMKFDLEELERRWGKWALKSAKRFKKKAHKEFRKTQKLILQNLP